MILNAIIDDPAPRAAGSRFFRRLAEGVFDLEDKSNAVGARVAIFLTLVTAQGETTNM